MFLTDPFTAFCFNEAVGTWGAYVESELDKITGKSEKKVQAKRQQRLLALLGAPDEVRFKKLDRPPKVS